MTIHSERSYLQKNRFVERQIPEAPPKDLELVVVIPSYGEHNLLRTLNSLETCQHPGCSVEVIIIINGSSRTPDSIRQLNEHTRNAVQSWKREKKRQFDYFPLYFPDLPPKHAGVGLARKIGMDEAVDRFEAAGKEKGVILALDADSTVSPDYLTTVRRQFMPPFDCEGCSIYFEHPVGGSEFEATVYQGIIRYELFLRYYIEGLRFAGHPYAFHTIGSSMAVRADIYQAEGGMNRRKAGEDFYFLHKVIPRGKFYELNAPRVVPSPRPSDKVPFGTGKAIGSWLAQNDETYMAYAPEIFRDLKAFLRQVPYLYMNPPLPLPDSVSAFLEKEDFDRNLEEIRKHVAGIKGFVKRFYGWFHALRVLKYVHFARDNYYPDVPVEAAASALYQWVQGGKLSRHHALYWLHLYRDWQRNKKFP